MLDIQRRKTEKKRIRLINQNDNIQQHSVLKRDIVENNNNTY